MINFILYEENGYYMALYENIIHKFMGSMDDRYKIYKYLEYTSKMCHDIKTMEGQRVYIMEISGKGKSGLDLAKDIRKYSNTVNDQIIFITEHTELFTNAQHNKLLMLDFISKYDDIETNLISCLNTIYMYFTKNRSLMLKQDGEIIRVMYDDILYIAKDNADDYLYIYTTNNKIKCNNSLLDLENDLKDDLRFIRTHRSAIVNVSKITKIDMINNIIYFNKVQMGYLSRKNKKILEQKMSIFGK